MCGGGSVCVWQASNLPLNYIPSPWFLEIRSHSIALSGLELYFSVSASVVLGLKVGIGYTWSKFEIFSVSTKCSKNFRFQGQFGIWRFQIRVLSV